jgi:hypothetical protein
MRARYLFPIPLVGLFAIICLFPLRTLGQSDSVRPLITQAVDDSKLTVLKGNTHPLARPQFDLEAVPATQPVEHMLLVLKRSPEQEAALESVLAQLQNPSSPNFHKWLAPEQFGQQFGPSDRDVQTITSWLQAKGFQVNAVSKGRTTIDFSGTAGTVQQAFHTSIHSYVLPNGQQHWANSSDPQIPTALTPVVAGVNSLNNFRKKPLHRARGVVRKDLATGKFTRINPQFTFAGYPYDLCAGASGTNNCWAVGPGDFNTIYNVPSTVNGVGAGTGQTIAIASDSDIYVSDVNSFRSLFGMPAINFQQIETGADPGVENNSSNSDEQEAILDVEWASVPAPYAAIDLVVSPSTPTFSTFGGDTSAAYVIDCPTVGTGCPVAVPASVLSYSYGTCELELGTAQNQFYNAEWQQAAAEGITVVVATGDSGSAGCDDPNANQPAQFGLAVNGVASTPYNVAVGGTDFNDLNNPTSYWNNSAGVLNSARGYIPETTYDDSCTNPIIYIDYYGLSNPEQSCNDPYVEEYYLYPAGGGGGVSNCTAPTGPSPANCAGGYAKPSWQIGTGVPGDGLRDIPDVSFFAGDGTIQNFYIVCEADQDVGNAPCNLSVPAGVFDGEYYVDFLGEGGTSVSTQAFAGVVALLDQKMGEKQGNINPLLYALASTASGVFNDVTLGSNEMPCTVISGTPGCSITGSNSYSIGVLTGYSAGVGFDLATGLGSVNVGNLLNNVNSISYMTASTFVPVTPCRIADTRTANGPLGGPPLTGQSFRDFPVTAGSCGIPSTATAYSVNVTVVPHGTLGYISIWPSGQPQPLVSTLNSLDGRVKANAAIVPAGTSGSISLYSTDATDVILDVNGYFVPSGTPSALAFYPVPPCRIADTRNATGPLGGPALFGGQGRTFPVLSSACGIPSTAQAYSLNFTAIPDGPLGYLSVWPAGQAEPFVSTLNAPTGTVTANAAIVPAGAGGSIDAYATNITDLAIDINGYFAPPGAGGLSFYTLPPCRVIDTRQTAELTGTLGVNVTGSGCGVPGSAQAYVFNATVVPPSPLGYLTLWPFGGTQPLVSTLNALDGALTSNMAIVPAGSGSVDAYASNPTQLLLDISGYFAP